MLKAVLKTVGVFRGSSSITRPEAEPRSARAGSELAPVGEGEVGMMAGAAGDVFFPAQDRVEEEQPPQRDPFLPRGVAGRIGSCRERFQGEALSQIRGGAHDFGPIVAASAQDRECGCQGQPDMEDGARPCRPRDARFT
jgi:hypothetical protein